MEEEEGEQGGVDEEEEEEEEGKKGGRRKWRNKTGSFDVRPTGRERSRNNKKAISVDRGTGACINNNTQFIDHLHVR